MMYGQETRGPPFALPQRHRARQLRRQDLRSPPAAGPRQAMAGFEPGFGDIVDYIVRITDEIWIDRAVGRIYDTYDASCTVYSSYGVVRSVEEVVAGTVVTLDAFPDGEIHHLSVAWDGDEAAGFYTSHLGHSRATNVGATGWGPGTGKRSSIRFAADCISRENRIHTEWLVRDAGAQVRQLGLDVHECARRVAAGPQPERPFVRPEPRLAGAVPRRALEIPRDTPDGWARHLFHDLWVLRRFDLLPALYADTAVLHSGGGRVAAGPRSIGSLLIHIQAALPDGMMRVEHVCWAEESDGVIVAVRWVLEGTTRPGALLGDCPAGKPVFMMGVTHMRLGPDGRIAEEWQVFDEVGVLAQAYRA